MGFYSETRAVEIVHFVNGNWNWHGINVNCLSMKGISDKGMSYYLRRRKFNIIPKSSIFSNRYLIDVFKQ